MKRFPVLLLLAFSLSVLVGVPSFAGQAERVRLFDLAVKMMEVSSSSDKELRDEVNALPPQEKNEVFRMMRRLSEVKYGTPMSEEHCRKVQKLEEVFMIAEGIALERHNKALMDISNDELKGIMKEALSRYPGEVALP